MSEKYSRVYELPQNLYASGSPVVISAGALLKDNQSEKIIAQVKLKSIEAKVIKAVTVTVSAFDSFGILLSEPIEYRYLDLNVKRDEDFGAKNPIILPNAATRLFSVAVTKIAFADNSVWRTDGAPWEPLPTPETSKSALKDRELIKQYRIKYGWGDYMLTEHINLWRCACGEWNRQDEEYCHHCEQSYTELKAFDLEQLKAECAARLTVEAEQEAREQAKIAEEKAAEEARVKRKKKRGAIFALFAVIGISAILVVTKIIIPSQNYNNAVALMEAGEYTEASTLFFKLGNYKDSREQYTTIVRTFLHRSTLEANSLHTVGLKNNGTVVAIGNNDDGQCNVSKWTNIVAVSAGYSHTVGLKANGTVVAVGDNDDGQCDVNNWTDIVAVSAGYSYTIGLKSNGTTVAVGNNLFGECNVGNWTDIVAIFAGNLHTVGLKSDGTVVTVGYNGDGRCNVNNWTDIVAISAGIVHTVGLKADGTVVAVGANEYNEYGQCDVNHWTDIVAISAGTFHTVGLKADGTVVAVGDNDGGQCDVNNWTDIVAISAGEGYTVGLKADGTVVTVGRNKYCRYDLSNWADIKLPK